VAQAGRIPNLITPHVGAKPKKSEQVNTKTPICFAPLWQSDRFKYGSAIHSVGAIAFAFTNRPQVIQVRVNRQFAPVRHDEDTNFPGSTEPMHPFTASNDRNDIKFV
jgi:hypothetical protein